MAKRPVAGACLDLSDNSYTGLWLRMVVLPLKEHSLRPRQSVSWWFSLRPPLSQEPLKLRPWTLLAPHSATDRYSTLSSDIDWLSGADFSTLCQAADTPSAQLTQQRCTITSAVFPPVPPWLQGHLRPATLSRFEDAGRVPGQSLI